MLRSGFTLIRPVRSSSTPRLRVSGVAPTPAAQIIFSARILSPFSILPIVFIGIKWPASFGDISAAGTALTNLMTHVIHGVFLLACLYVSFDPPFSPRQLGTGFAFLPFYYLGALAIGYCSGYFLLIFGAVATGRAWQRPSVLQRLINYALVAVVWISLVCVPAGLIYKNLPQIQISWGRDLGKFGELAAQSLPPQGGVVLSDDPYRLYALQSALEQK